MKRCQKDSCSFLSVLFSMVMALLLAACGGGGSESAPPATEPAASTTTISGKVTLSSTVTAKPAIFSKSALSAAGVSYAAALTTATVELYDADHPEWLYPVATSYTNSNGDYTLEKLCAFNDPAGSASLNAPFGATYKCGDPIPAGNYTMIASKSGAGSTGGQAVAVQAVVKKLANAITGNNLTAADSTAVPGIVSMFGLSKNADGSFGGTATNLPVNAAIQVTFSMAMARLSVIEAITIKDATGATVPGSWRISADLLSAMFVPSNALAANKLYTVTVGGGTAAKTAKNVFGKAIAATAMGSFTTSVADTLSPNAVKESPASSTGVPITSAIRIAANEPLDVTTMSVASNPSIGDKPNVIYIGKTGKYLDYYYVYEIVPAIPLAVNTNYALTVSGGKDLAGNALTSVTINFGTEATSSGISVGTGAEADETAVKTVLGKWAQALNDQNISILTSYMAGDFYWINDPSNGVSSDDLNRDGRMDLQEFTSMLTTWFGQLKNCGSTVTMGIDTANAAVTGGIAVTGLTAKVAFTLTVSATNTASQCADSGPKNSVYAEMQQINGAWIMARGSDLPLAAATAGLTKLETSAPASGAQLPEPIAAAPAAPEFKWTASTWTNSAGAAVPFASYAVALIDNKSPWGETGWVAIVDGSTLIAGSTASVRFTPATGLSGGTLVLSSAKEFGFRNSITSIQAGGDYTWAVLGFKTKTQSDFNLGLANPLSDLGGSSSASNFGVAGTYKELKITAQDSLSKVYYAYNDWMGGFDAANANSVSLTITTPNLAAPTATVNVRGYTQQQLSAPFTNGVATVTVNLSNKQNWVEVCDDFVVNNNGGYCNGLKKQFNIVTTGGAQPKIKITSVTGKTCAGAATALGTADAWGTFRSANVCTVDVTGTVDPAISGMLNIQVWNNMDVGQYRGTVAVAGTTFTALNVPVFLGSNSVQVSDQNWPNTNMNQFNVETAAGSTYSPPIVGNLTGFVPQSVTLREAIYDVGNVASVTATVTMAVSTTCSPGTPTPCSSWNQTDSTGNWIAGGQITASPFTGPITLYQGWNYIGLNDAAGNNFRVKIYTTAGTPYVQPNAITGVSVGGVMLTPVAGIYNAAATCSVTITGETQNPGPVNVSLYSYNSASASSVSEYQSVPVTGTAAPYTYTFTQYVYNGINNISVNDSMWNWQGVNVNSTCMTVPVEFTATVAPATYDGANFYNAGAANQVTISGTAVTGKVITASISSGMSYIATASGGTYSLANVPIYNGYNYISVTDGANWQYLTVYTTGGAIYAEPFAITSVIPAAGDAGTITAMDTSGYSYSGSVSSVSISGTSNTDGTGYWYGGGTSGTFTVTGGAFNVAIPLLNGFNYVDLYGPNGAWDGVNISTTGGVAPTQFVKITSPLHNATAGGSVAVTATVDLTKGFTPDALQIYAYVYDYTTYQGTLYASSPCIACGDQPLTYNAATGVISFNAVATAGNPTKIEVNAFDASGMGHGHVITVNNAYFGNLESFYKPGSNIVSVGQARAKAHHAEFLKKMTTR